jgi:serine-type D-Ala-D-Ala carboxypeptidase/endopeptidase (penicillin-binding protein 4)
MWSIQAVRPDVRFSLPWWERARERGYKRRSPSPVSSPIEGEEKTGWYEIHILVCFPYRVGYKSIAAESGHPECNEACPACASAAGTGELVEEGLSERPVLSFIEGFFAEFILPAPVPQAQVSVVEGLRMTLLSHDLVQGAAVMDSNLEFLLHCVTNNTEQNRCGGVVVWGCFSVLHVSMRKHCCLFFVLCIAALVVGWPDAASARAKRGRAQQQAPEPVQLPQSPEILLEHSGLANEDVSYLLFDTADGSAVEEHRADEARVPASTVKVMTAIAALKILGEDYHFQTSLLVSGEVVDGALHGNVYLRGGGDPTLTTDDLRNLAGALADIGITNVTGSFIFDDTLLTRTDQIDHNISMTAPYNPGLSALSVNYNRIQLHWNAKPRKGSATPGAYSYAKGGTLPLEAITLGRQAEEFDANIAFLHEATNHGGPRLDRWLLSPKLPPQGWIGLPVRLDPGRITALLFRTLCQQKGVNLPLPEPAAVPADARLLATHWSEPLPEIVSNVLRFSNNMAAELIGLAASRKLSTHPLSLRESATTVTNWYLRQAPDAPWQGFHCANHSGLSSATRMTPRQLAAILRVGWSLSVRDSTFPQLLWPPMWERVRNDPEHTAVRAKSGTMNYADGLAGFLTTKQGRQLGFVILITNFPQRLAQDETQDVRATAAEPDSNGWTRRAKVLEKNLVMSWIARY